MAKTSRVRSIFVGVSLVLALSGVLVAEEVRIYDVKGLTRFSSAVKGDVKLAIDFSGSVVVHRVWLESEDGFNVSIVAVPKDSNRFVVRVKRPGQYKIHTDPPESIITSVRKE